MLLGVLRDGREVEAVEIAAGNLRARIATLGAALHALEAPDRHGAPGNIVLGYRHLDSHIDHPIFFGAIVGRFANRIGGASFALDGKRHRLVANDGPNQLHGGPLGFHARLWTIEAQDAQSVTLSLVSEDGDMGYPGRLEARVRYTLRDHGLGVEIEATSDAPTIASLSHHPYWNLAGDGAGTIEAHWLRIAASRFTPVDETLIPTGERREVAGTPFDFRMPRAIGAGIGADDAQLRLGQGYDHNWAVDGWNGDLRWIASLFDPGSGRVVDVAASQPGLQFYSGNHMTGLPPGTGGRQYGLRSGLCLEPQHFPDAPNQPGFPSARLDPGGRFRSEINYRLRAAGDLAEAFPGA